MTDAQIISLGSEALKTTLIISAPLLIGGMVVGLIISVFQSITQIHEMTVTFVPKILAVGAILFFCSPWMLRLLLDYITRLYSSIPIYIR